jgi:uncharacterized membrane protein YphA (DoxX/SURF4 family)
MRLGLKARHIPGRLTTGSFILNSGLSKLSADDQTATRVHGMATESYPALKRIDPKVFTKLVAGAELVIGTALLVPVVPTAIAAVGLAGFSLGLLGLYLRTPGMHQRGTLRPTPDGLALAKDVWMLGIATGFLTDELTAHKKSFRKKS